MCVCVVQAEADSVDALEKYRGKCEPTFLFYGVCMCVCVETIETIANYNCEPSGDDGEMCCPCVSF